MKTKIWLGLGGTIKGDDPRGTIFRDAETSTPDRYSFATVIGPFRTLRGARFMREHGRGNPHIQCVNDAERIAAGLAYDIVLRKWVKTRAAMEAAELG